MEEKQKESLARFKKVKDVHLEYFNGLLQKQQTRNLTIGIKRKRMKEKFPNLEISKTTI